MINIGDRPSPDFSDPLGLLSDCHRRIERFLDVLIAITEQARGQALSPAQREALANALRYFREAAPKHTSDEDDSLFPRLRALGDARLAAALEPLQVLESDHRAATLDHEEVDALCRRWLAEGHLSPGATRELAGRLQELHALYRHHIGLEDTRIFPLARAVLPPEQIAEIGYEMAQRRGLRVAGHAGSNSPRPRAHRADAL